MQKMDRLVTFDEALDALADVQRRMLLLSLLDHNPQDADPVATGGTESETEALQRLTTMNHVHLPKLVDYGFIEWDEDANEVSKGADFVEIRPLLELLEEHGDDLPGDWV